MSRLSRHRAWLAVIVASVIAGAAPTTAGAHVQVRPDLAAPSDAVEFTVLVPGETAARTTEVALAIPKDVIPFSYGEAPGWKLAKKEASDGSISELVWRGSLAPDGFAKFSFLASTPEKPTTIVWKSIQRYSDGEVVRWIGSPESEYPASRTVVSADAPLQGAGGRHSEAAPETAEKQDQGAPTWTGPVALAALIVALIALALALVAARRRGSTN